MWLEEGNFDISPNLFVKLMPQVTLSHWHHYVEVLDYYAMYRQRDQSVLLNVYNCHQRRD